MSTVCCVLGVAAATCINGLIVRAIGSIDAQTGGPVPTPSYANCVP